jgi:hypothetical protein
VLRDSAALLKRADGNIAVAAFAKNARSVRLVRILGECGYSRIAHGHLGTDLAGRRLA